MALSSSSMQSRAGTIRRVIRRGDDCLCGLCRTVYESEGEAQACIMRCWSQLLTLDPVLVRKALGSTSYRCRFCARDFARRPEAVRCADACKAAQKVIFDRELGLLDAVDDQAGRKAPPAPRPRLVRVPIVTKPKLKAPPVTAKLDKASEAPVETAQADLPPPVAAPLPVAAAAPAAAPAAAGAAGDAHSKKDDAAMFMRDGARYVCRNCNAKYFTRDDVVNCFQGHK